MQCEGSSGPGTCLFFTQDEITSIKAAVKKAYFYTGDQNQMDSFVLNNLLNMKFLFKIPLGTLMAEIALTRGLVTVTGMRKLSLPLDNLLSKSHKTLFLHVKSKGFIYFSASLL